MISLRCKSHTATSKTRGLPGDIECLDTHLTALFDGFKERGLCGGALIVFTADHGEEFYDHEGWWHGFTLYGEMSHVPIMLKLPCAGKRAVPLAWTHSRNQGKCEFAHRKAGFAQHA